MTGRLWGLRGAVQVDRNAAVPILARVKFKGFAPASDRDYDGVRRVYKQIGQ